MPQTFCCKRCNKTSTNIKLFFGHLNRHRRTRNRKKYYNFSPQVLQIYIDTDYQFQFDEEDEVIDFGYEHNDDFGVLCMEVFDLKDEGFALEVLNIMDFNKCCDSICQIRIDDRDKLREYLLDLGIIDKIDCDLCEVHENYSYEEWEEFCHFTNNDMLMLCIKRGWKDFCLRLLDFDDKYIFDINKQNITNSYEMALKYGLDEVAEKIKSCERFTLNVNGKAV
jgi:hypothetical protein